MPNLIGHTLYVIVMVKSCTTYLLLMDCKSSDNTILGRDHTIFVEVVALSRYQCVNFLYQGRITMIHSKQWGSNLTEDRKMININLSDTNGNTILAVAKESRTSSMA